MTIQGDGHIFKRFDKEMRHLHELVLEMGALAERQLREAVSTLQSQDVAAARQVVENDRKINDLDIQADDQIIHIIALRQPMARDLREIIAVGKIIAELERAGDEARKIAGLTMHFYTDTDGVKAPSEEILQDIYQLADFVGEMLSTAMRALDDLDLGRATTVLDKSLRLDAHLREILQRLSGFIGVDTDNARHFVDIVLGIRALERFGGHAKNIAGHIVFIKDGTDVRHAGIERILQKIERGWDGG